MPHSNASWEDVFFAEDQRRHGNPFPGPFDSPLEERFADALRPHIAADVRVNQQQVFYTVLGRFVIDFVFTFPDGFRLAVECDGAEFHERTADAWRDAALISEHRIDLMVRLDGRFLYAVPADVLYLLSTIAPGLVSARGRQNIEKLSTGAVKRYNRQTPGLILVDYPTLDELRYEERKRREEGDDPDASEGDDPWYTEANHKAETGPKYGLLYVTYEGRGVALAGYGWRDRARLIAQNPGASLRDLVWLATGEPLDASTDSAGKKSPESQDEEDPTVPVELSGYLLPSEAPPEPPYLLSEAWMARVVALQDAEPIARPRSDMA